MLLRMVHVVHIDLLSCIGILLIKFFRHDSHSNSFPGIRSASVPDKLLPHFIAALKALELVDQFNNPLFDLIVNYSLDLKVSLYADTFVVR